MLELTLADARALHLIAQGLGKALASPATKSDVLSAVRQMGALQIDTIHVVARSPYLVLWSRLGDYRPEWLDELLAEGEIFEQRAHEACFVATEDFPLHRRVTLDRRERALEWLDAHPEAVASVLARISERGEAKSSDFRRIDGRRGTWWDWKPEKRALEWLLYAGDLMVARRERFQRVYAPREAVLPDWDDSAAPPTQEARRELARRAVRALGVTTARWLPDYFRMPKHGVEDLLESFVAEGMVVPARVEGIAAPAYVDSSLLSSTQPPSACCPTSSVTTILSPFDPVVWHRERTRDLFGLDFRIECYVPAPKRSFGYFALPLLHRGAIVGQIDAKAHRADGLFEVKALRLAPGVEPDEGLVAELARALVACAAWHGTPEVAIRHCEPEAVGPALEAEVRRSIREA